MSAPLAPEAIQAALTERGFVVTAAPARPAAEVDPWGFVEALLGARPALLERQAIRPLPGGRSFAATSGFTPLHTDSQDLRGRPPGLLAMVCRRPAARGGESLLVDGWAVLEAIEREEPALLEALFSEERSVPFYFGAVRGPTVARKGGALVLTVSPMEPGDAVGRALAGFLARAPRHEVRVAEGEVLLVDNHRVLHGRRAFDGGERDFLRLLAWLEAPLGHHPRFAARAREIAPLSAATDEGEGRTRAVCELLGGVAPARVAERFGVTEATLYAWRSAFVAAGAAALGARADEPRPDPAQPRKG